MEIPTLTLEELKIIAAVLLNTSYRLADSVKVVPIYDKLLQVILKLDPPPTTDSVKKEA